MNNEELRQLEESISKIQDRAQRQLAQMYYELLIDLKNRISTIYEQHAINGVVPREVWHTQNYIEELEVYLTESINAITPVQFEVMKEALIEVYEESYYRESFSINKGIGFGVAMYGLLKLKDIQKHIFNPLDSKRWTTRHRANNKYVSHEILKIIKHGIKNGYAYDKVAKLITEKMDIAKGKAIKITNTETARMQTTAQYESMKVASEKGVEMQKQWVSTLDGKTRDAHQKLDGTVVGLDDYFMIDGAKAKCPHQFGEAEHDINCRCRVISRIANIPLSVRISRETDGERGELIEYTDFKSWRKDLK